MIYVNSVDVSPANIGIRIGQWYYDLRATVCPTNATYPSVTWTSSNTDVATVNPSTGYVYGRCVGTVKITATATDGSGKSDYCYVTVAPVMVDSVRVTPARKTLLVEDTTTLSAIVTPTNATNPTINWRSNDPNIAEVSTDGVVTAKAPGETRVYAETEDGSGERDYCDIEVVDKIRVECVTVPSKKVIKGDKPEYITPTIWPSVATDQTVVWESNNTIVATIDNTGKITAHKDGVAIMTVTTNDGKFTASCEVTVDSRDRVIIRKDYHSFYVKFEDEKIWNFIGLDLSKRKENYGSDFPPPLNLDNKNSLIEEEERYLDNVYVKENGVYVKNSYSIEQIAYLYLLDPLGIDYYMNQEDWYNSQNMTFREKLTFKDDVYEAIFGTSERENGKFYFRVVDETPIYSKYLGDRMDVYSNAEILFGFHTIITWDWSKFIKSFLEGVFELAMEDSVIGKGLQAYKTLMHAGGILNTLSSETSSYVMQYFSNNIGKDLKNYYTQKYGKDFAEDLTKKLGELSHWAICLVIILKDSIESALDMPNPHAITIYNQISTKPNFLTIIDIIDDELTMNDIINKIN